MLKLSEELIKNLEYIGKNFSASDWKLSVAESCTGGLLGACITSISGASAWFQGGIIAYDNAVKMNLLNVSEKILIEHGAVSLECVLAMATGLCMRMQTNVGISISGIAGPSGGTEDKPVGTVYVGYCIQGETFFTLLNLKGTREEIREQAVNRAIVGLIGLLDAYFN